MPGESVSMRRVREILRLKFECGASGRAIAVAVGVARSTVERRLARIVAAGLNWPLPTRAHRPRDKAKVEVGVLVVERWILARLHLQRFVSLAEVNAAIAVLVANLND